MRGGGEGEGERDGSKQREGVYEMDSAALHLQFRSWNAFHK